MGVVLSAPAEEGPAEVAGSAATAPPAVAGADGRDGADRRRRLVSRMWWHAPRMVQLLDLSDGQKARMDGAALRFLTGRDGSVKRAREGFRRALAEGRLDEASELLEQYGEAAARARTAEGRMTVEVLRALTADQLELLRTERPRLLEGRWLVRVGGRQGRPGVGGQAGSPRPPESSGGGR